MNQIEETVREHEERCAEELPSKYVSWRWLTGIIIGIIIILCATAWRISAGVTSTQSTIGEHEKRITKIESIYEDIKWIRKKLEK